ncbi:phage antirepressor N-terminal domain-containing protein [Vibrio plantisponsor]|uniref:Phage antirepressor N-terminal domain-containing protein n=1 Tax=Vibrio plantisponsor TaxID=664643 RepID=A0ABU4IDZ8_9VIBR|nr:phage antirepressor N-terminal domain-containing protein [Vibrio plantisponsor]MDW6016792.1 phage antirepressor N-terminal domain-containing protein [Vibrio plantisponsor]NNM39837.1 phage antirepressor N-terminal domain-containing protein [Vibrio plantisponsor]
MSNQIKVPFHGSNLFIVDHNGEPYTPMKSIVEGMGMSWQGQHEKIKSNPERWGIKVILIPSVDRNNAMTCLPLRKLFGWLQTLQPNRVREDIRDKVIQYQNECDDVLWKHWTKQNTPNEIMPVMPPSSMRVLMYMEKGHVVSMQPVSEDSVVFRTEDIPKLLKEPGYFTVQQLKNVADTALSQLAMCAEQAMLLRR